MMETVKPTTLTSLANPAPLGLFGFGMTTILLNLHNAGLFPIDAMILAMGIFYGGMAQILAGYLEFKKNNTFGLTAFVSYGFFWLTLAGILVFPGLGWMQAPSALAMALYLFAWGCFTALLLIGTFKISRILQLVFLTLTVLFFLLAIGDLTGNPQMKKIAGVEGIFCGMTAVYAGIANILNELFERDLLPVGAVR